MADLATVAEAPETDAPSTEAPLEETDQVEEIADTEDDGAETTESFTREQLEAQVKERLEAREAEQQATWEKQSYEREKSAAQRERSGELMRRAYGLANWVAKEVESGRDTNEVMGRVNQGVVQSLVTPLEAMVFSEQWESIGDSFTTYAQNQAPEWKPSPELSRKLEQAMASKDPNRLIQARWDYLKDAVLAAELPKALDAEKQKQKPVKTLQQRQAQDSKLASQERPTGVGGNSSPRGRTFSTMLQVDTAFANGEITKQEMYRNLQLHEAGRLPYS